MQRQTGMGGLSPGEVPVSKAINERMFMRQTHLSDAIKAL
jgi:hypothetical protein